MGKVYFDISMSLDGFIAASDRTPKEPMGQDGERLHAWLEDPESQELFERSVERNGAVITGRRTYDDSVPWWGADGPTGSLRRPVFVVTHTVPDSSPANGVYTFVTTGIDVALDQARYAAGGLDVTVMGGADLGRQYLRAGLVDELSIHLVPVLLGSGTRMFDAVTDDHLGLTIGDVLSTPSAIHTRFALDH